MNQILLLVLMFCGGIAIAVQPSINGRLAQKVGTLESSSISDCSVSAQSPWTASGPSELPC